MRRYFPFSAAAMKRRYAFGIFALNLPALHVILAAIVTVLLGGAATDLSAIKAPLLAIALATGAIAGTLSVGLLRARHMIAMHKKYTYLEFSPQCVMYSRYAGCTVGIRRATVYRTLDIIPIEALSGIKRLPRQKAGLTGVFRHYVGTDERLAYRIRRGKVVFENWWLNDNDYREIKELILPPEFEGFYKFLALTEEALENHRAVQGKMEASGDQLQN